MECQCTDMAKQQFVAIRWPEIKLQWDEFSAGSDIYVKQRLLEWSWFLSTLFQLHAVVTHYICMRKVQNTHIRVVWNSVLHNMSSNDVAAAIPICQARCVLISIACMLQWDFILYVWATILLNNAGNRDLQPHGCTQNVFLIVLWSYRYCLEDLGDILAYILKGRHTGSGGTKLFVWRATTLRYCCCILVFRNKIHLQPNQLHGLYILHWMYVWVYRSWTHIYINGSDI